MVFSTLTSIILIIAVIFLMIVMFTTIRLYSKSVNERNKLEENLEEAKNEIEKHKDYIEMKNNKIKELEYRLDNLKKGEETTLEAFSVKIDSIENCINSIKKNSTVSNKNKIILQKLLMFHLLCNQASITLDSLKVNKLSINDNIKVIRKYFVLNSTALTDKEKIDLGNSILTLVCYNRK